MGFRRLKIPEAFHTYNRGSIELALYSCAAACNMRAVLTITPQEYLYGLGEVPSSWPVEAMAIGGRHYRGSSVDQNFDVYSVQYTYPDGTRLFYEP